MQRRHILVLATALCLGIGAASVAGADEPTMAESRDPDELVTDSRNPCDHEGAASDPDDLAGESEAPDATATAGNPDERTAEAVDPDELAAAAAASAEPEIAPMPEPPDPNDDAQARAAWSEVERTASRLEEMNDAYEAMLSRGYPRGEARAQLVAERNEAIREANAARARYRELALP